MKNIGRMLITCLLLAATVLCCCGCGPQEPEIPAKKVPVTFKLNNGFGEVVVEMEEGKPLNNAPAPTMRGAV